MVVGASITVNNSRNSGSIDSGGQAEDTKLLKQILAQLKEMNKQSMVAGRKASSGIGTLGGAAGGGLLSGGFTKSLPGLIAAAIGAVGYLAGVSGGGDSSFNPNVAKDEFGQTTSSFAQVSAGGQDFIFELDKKTGDVLNVLTMEEAERQYIVDSLGNISKGLRDQETEAKSILSEMEEAGGTYFTNNEKLDLIKTHVDDYEKASKETLHWAKVESAAKKIIAERLARKAGMSVDAFATTTSEERRRGQSLVDRGATPLIQFVNSTGASYGDQTSSNIEKELLYSVDTSNVSRNVFWQNATWGK
jgi:hypothetical protein